MKSARPPRRVALPAMSKLPPSTADPRHTAAAYPRGGLLLLVERMPSEPRESKTGAQRHKLVSHSARLVPGPEKAPNAQTRPDQGIMAMALTNCQ